MVQVGEMEDLAFQVHGPQVQKKWISEINVHAFCATGCGALDAGLVKVQDAYSSFLEVPLKAIQTSFECSSFRDTTYLCGGLGVLQGNVPCKIAFPAARNHRAHGTKPKL